MPNGQRLDGHAAAIGNKGVFAVGVVLKTPAGCSDRSASRAIELPLDKPLATGGARWLRPQGGERAPRCGAGRSLGLRDSINHEAWNNSADDRIVLIFDVWHPDLTEQERRDITSLLETVSAERGAVAQSLLRLACSQK